MNQVVTLDNARALIRTPRPTDQSFIAATWVDSWQMGDRSIARSDANRTVDRLLDDRTSRVLVACDVTNEDTILGWLCYVPTPRCPVLHYVYVRRHARGHGIGAELLARARGNSERVAYTMRGPDAKRLAAKYPDAIKMELADMLG